MNMQNIDSNSYLFETSWEVCNKVGGIYTVVSTKIGNMQKIFGDHYFLIGPDVWKGRDNKEFIEDKKLYARWKIYAGTKGLSFRIGHWNIAGSPIVILVDFLSLISKKDEILSDFWCDYKLDSIEGQWDYLEPVLFGYAAGKVIETFYEYEVYPQEKVYAHFHEWMTGSGVLYLKKNIPAIATVFTTHATVLGRCVAGNSLPLYGSLTTYNGDELSHKFGVRSKFSMEKLSALEADAFTTVSEITDKECKQFFGKSVDVVTPNGFDDTFIPSKEEFGGKRDNARKILKKACQALLNTPLDDNALFVINSGRYEFKNKGIDLYIDALARLNKDEKLKRQIVAVVAVPADHAGARSDVLSRMNHGIKAEDGANMGDYCTHYLNSSESDPVLKRLKLDNLLNSKDDKVKVVFIPCYLDGKDGIFDIPYYDLLIGFDLSVFPSYYEPWGYTPLESVAFSIPTITTSVAGFGKWVQDAAPDKKDGVCVIERGDDNDPEVVAQISDKLAQWASLSDVEMDKCRAQAYDVSRFALWSELSKYYVQAYEKASSKWDKDRSLLNKPIPKEHVKFSIPRPSSPQWRKVMIKTTLPQELSRLEKLSLNLWWSWNSAASNLFESIDVDKWEECGHNPVALLDSLSIGKMKALIADQNFISALDNVYDAFTLYMNEAKDKSIPSVAYFSMEFGLHESLKIYSGGLGILAGDYLKAASDKNVDMVGVGLLYRYGYFKQTITAQGSQRADYMPQAFSKLPLLPVRDEDGSWQMVTISLPGRKIKAKIWRVDVGRIPLYLLDTDIEENNDADRSITHQLYGGDWENRFKQEFLLGIGGIRMLRKLKLNLDVFHCNEGHGAFMGLERLREYTEVENISFLQACELVKSATLFTTHTPVPAGHDAFSEDIMRTYMSHYPNRLKITWEQFMALGRTDEESKEDKFSMSFLAAHLSEEINGVSRIHGRVSRDIFAPLYAGYYPQELDNIGYVTNGVHYKTWAHPLWQNLYNKYFGENFKKDISDHSAWEKIQEVPDDEIWQIRTALRKRLIDFLRDRLQEEIPRRGDAPQEMIKVIDSLNPNALTFGFARRFATYKRAHLLFSNLDRLQKILNNSERPVQFLFAGKAHPADKAGQDLIKRIIEISRMPAFQGKIVFIENYDVDVAKYLVQGVDVWVNTPTRPMEASGTSGEKAIMNGVLNLSVLDGWWAEGYREGAGWALKEEQTYENPAYQDQLDAETIYMIIEKSIIPTFYSNKEDKKDWVQYIKNNIAYIAPNFTMRRQIDDYYRKYYIDLDARHKLISADNYKKAWAITKWRINVNAAWEDVHIKNAVMPEFTQKPLSIGEKISFAIVLDSGGLNPEDIGVEVVLGQKKNDIVEKILFKYTLEFESEKDGRFSYSASWNVEHSGVYDYAFRVYPKHPDLVHRQDVLLVKWV